MKKEIPSQKNTNAPLLTEIATAYATIKKSSSPYIVLLALLGTISPFFSFLVPTDMPGIFGYAYMGSVLWSLAVPFMAISYGLLINVLAHNTPDEYRLPYQLLSTVILFVGIFFLIFTFIPLKKNIPYTVHMTGLFFASVGGTLAFVKINRVLIAVDARLKRVIKRLFTFIITDVKDANLIDADKEIEYLIETEKVINEVSDIV